MDVISSLQTTTKSPITCIDMHTTGEPTRIIISGYPPLSGTLLEQRTMAKAQYDNIRKRLMLEPAGHADMYGAILRPETELTATGDAHIGVLFCHNEGYSTMCGHASIALGRFLLDTQDLDVFPRRREVEVEGSRSAQIRLHAPCGLVKITVPVMKKEDGKGWKSDPSRPVGFINVPSFATGRDIDIAIPQADRWSQIRSRESIKVSFCYGGAFTCLVSIAELGFGSSGLRQPVDLDALNIATKRLKDLINSDPQYAKYMKHPEIEDVGSLYTLMVVDKNLGTAALGSKGAETGLCYFADQQIDRSPTGSAVAARVAFAYAISERKMGESWTYHSLVSNGTDRKGGFVGTVVEELSKPYDEQAMLGVPVHVRVEGYAYYVGSHIFVAEEDDYLRDGGFLFSRLE